MTRFSSFSGAGIAAIQAGIVNINGCPMGISGSLAEGSGAALKLLQFSKRFGGQVPSPVRATVKGDNNRSRVEFVFNPDQMGELSFQFGSEDLDFYAGVSSVKKVADGNGNGVVVQSNAPVNGAQACVVVNVDAQSADAGTFGLKRFANEIYPLVTIASLMGNIQEVQAIDWGYFGVPTQAGQLPWGLPFTEATHGATRAGGYMLTSDYPIVLETFVAGADSPTTYDLTYTPATPTSTYALAWNFTTGMPVSITVTGKTATFAALSKGDILVFRYEAIDLLASL